MWNRRLNTFVMLGLVGGTTGLATAQPYLINLTGATLLENPLTGNALTNDVFDVNGNGVFLRNGGGVDNLNPASTPSTIGANDWWVIQYRLVGSVNGFQELVSFADVMVTDDHTGLVPGEGFTSKAYFNRTRFLNNNERVNSGAGSGMYNEGNPGGFPARMLANFVAQFENPPTPSAGFWRADIAPVDVPALWAAQSVSAGAPAFFRLPGEPGYGRNDIVTLNKDGTVNGFSHLLVELGQRNLDKANADAQTIFDTPIAYAPVAAMTNFGTGLREMRHRDLRHLYITGRTQGGENLIAITREVGSGTHNAWANSLCIDPSWAVGENVGGLNVQFPVNSTIVGPDYIPGNTLGSGEMEANLQQTRLGIGYTGAERGAASGWLVGGRMELLAVINDHIGGTQPVRPTLAAVLNNGDPDTAWRIGGIATLNTLGDPRAAGPAFGGDSNGNPQMINPHAAAFINNITLSIEDFNFLGGTPFSPAEDLANRGLFLPASPDFLPSEFDPCDYILQPADTLVKDRLQNFYFNISSNPLKTPAYATFGTVTLNGKVPVRTTGETYSDGVPGGANYVQQDGTPLIYGANLNDRNRIAGDFNGDGERNWNDIPDLIAAWRDRNGGPAWNAPDGNAELNHAPGSTACIEILGDFNCDGNFDEQDIRYFADGLSIDPASGSARLLNRKEGFVRVDTAFGGNFFGTTLANPNAAYTPGASRGDVAGAVGTTPNFQPIGHDGRIDAADIDYVYANFVSDWSDTFAAVGKDLSCDMTGDLVIDQRDVCELVRDILQTDFGDANLDGVIDSVDRQIVLDSIANPPAVVGWATGDFNGDGVVNHLDLAILDGAIDPCTGRCPADLSGSSDPNDPAYGVPDGVADASDFFYYLDQFVAGNIAVADLTGSSDPNDPAYGVPDGNVDASDFFFFLDIFVAGCP
ncbi:MAG: dockerin type I repeat-containing protein [Phycisphaeraceae bacterium]|nr:dockerin type I repeat-containing protein [Phycisphaeraceae bacterium]MCW5754980.1 dockerin type I repeat-containing protein [Phycisphaeraceae bacterium]